MKLLLPIRVTSVVNLLLTVTILMDFSACGHSERVTKLPLLAGKNIHTMEKAEAWPGITRIWYYKPPVADSLRVLMVIHGAGRNAEAYLDSWIEIADQHNLVVVAPEFAEKRAVFIDGGWEWRFNIGNVESWFGFDVNNEKWYFHSVENVFQEIRSSNERIQAQYDIFGHSAGGQFVHRMVLLHPQTNIDRAIAANAGWYTFPDETKAFPFGIAGIKYSADQLKNAFERNLIVFLGTADTPAQGSFRSSPKAMSQGSDRVQRGVNFYEEAKRIAENQELIFNWKLEFADEIGHDFAEMTRASVRLLQTDQKVSNRPAN